MNALKNQNKLAPLGQRFSLKASVKIAHNAIQVINLLERKGRNIKGEPIIRGLGIHKLHLLTLELTTNSGKRLIDYL